MNSIIKPVNPDYNTNIRLLEELSEEFPFLETEIQGRTPLNRGIFSFSIGNPAKRSLLAGGFHGTDSLSGPLLMLFTERLCRCVKYSAQMCGTDVRRALSQVGITVIPCINPDGREIVQKGFRAAKNLRRYLSEIAPDGHKSWKANAFGADISRNFSRGWSECRLKEYESGCAMPSADGYCGERAESEAETKVLTRLCRMRSFSRCMSLSAGENDELYRYTGENAPASGTMMGKIIADSASCVFREASESSSAASFSRWFGEEFSRVAFSLTLKDNHSSPDELCSLYNRIEEALLLFLLF